MLVGNLKINNDLKAFATLSYAQSKDHFDAHPVLTFSPFPAGRVRSPAALCKVVRG